MPSDMCSYVFPWLGLHLDASTDRQRRNLWTRPPQKKHRQLRVQLQLVLRVELHVLCTSVELSIFHMLFPSLQADLTSSAVLDQGG